MVQASALGIPILRSYRLSANKLFKSMRRLSTGERINRPGDAPSDYGISENLRRQIRNTDQARMNVENINDLIGASDAWLSVGHDILKRMSELAISAGDGSKQQGDRDKLNEEYLQLRDEISRISRDARYNGVQIAGRDQVLTYDADRETFLMSQLDGTESYPLPVKILSGLQTDNNQDFLFDSSKDFTLSKDGTAIFYVDSNDNMTRYNIEENTLERDTADSNTKGLDVDEHGNLWYSTETAPGSGLYSLRQQNISTWTQDTSVLSSTSITDLASPNDFKIYDNRVYYRQVTTNDIVSRDISYLGDLRIELAAVDYPLNTTAGQFTISDQGLYVADVQNTDQVRIINVVTKEIDVFDTGASSVTDLSFSVDSNIIAFNDTTERKIYTLDVEVGDDPAFTGFQQIHSGSGTIGFRGLSLDGGSHRGNFRVHNGPHHLQQAFMQGADIRAYILGLNRSSILTIDDAQKAVKDIQNAMEIVSVQRAILGAAESRFSFSRDSLVAYNDNISMAESRLREANLPEEVSRMANEQVVFEGAGALLVQANNLSRVALQLLAR